jgi:hypothetical protein
MEKDEEQRFGKMGREGKKHGRMAVRVVEGNDEKERREWSSKGCVTRSKANQA